MGNQINKSSEYFNTKLYTGTGATQSITGVGFQPDFVWIKDRTSAYNHYLYDIIRTPLNVLQTNATDANATQTDGLSSFNSDGFSLLNNRLNVNASGDSFVSWNWLAGGTAVSNTDGSITSSVSANTTSGFSIVTYTGTGSLATIGHGLGSVGAPKMIIAKNRGSTSNWDCYHVGLSGANYRIQLNSTGAESISGGSWGSTAPTSSVFTVQDDTATNVNGNTYVAYCFAEKKGFSKFGKYTGNGNADGTFIYTGFKPAMVIIKRTDGIDWWGMWDTKRNPSNAVDKRIYAQTSGAEQVITNLDIYSTGFKLRTADGAINASGGNYIYMAFAEQPLVGTNNIPACAR